MKNVNGNSILILTRYPSKNDLHDGYFRRVFNIDNKLSEFNKLYVNYSKKNLVLFPKVNVIENGIKEIFINPLNPLHLFFLIYTVRYVNSIYFHSIYRLRSPFHKFLYVISKKRIIDLHGAVPEELEMQNEKKEAIKFSKIEKFAIKKADIIISVTNKLTEHIKKKYILCDNDKFLTIPILPDAAFEKKKIVMGNEIVYCGGLQRWQQIDKMIDYINREKDNFRFTIVTPNVEEFVKIYKKKISDNFPGIIQSANDSKLLQGIYSKNAWGLVLREDNIVNKVACPTKLSEYLANEIVPIVDYADIGDYKDLGYRYVNYNDKLPSLKEWKNMVNDNNKVLDKMRLIFNEGIESLKQSL